MTMDTDRITLDAFIVSLAISFGLPFFLLLGYSNGTRVAGELLPPVKKTSLEDRAYVSLLPSPEAVAKGKSIFTTLCALCHGEKGDGKGPAGAALKPPPRNFTNPEEKWTGSREPKDIFKAITEGTPGTAMVGFRASVSFQDRWALVHYLSTFAGVKDKYTPLTEETAKALYNEIAE